ncbi:Peroxidasin [Nymphon striatum]|nr:Peroxidasin [Nymphon striatum]
MSGAERSVSNEIVLESNLSKTKVIMNLEKGQILEHLNDVDMSGTELLKACPVRKTALLNAHCPPEKSYMFRKADGSCNNLLNPRYGKAMQPFNRFLHPDYSDGIQGSRRSSNPNNELPSARRVSLVFTEQKSNPNQNASLMLMIWGQFVDHDLTHTALSVGFNGSKIKCCGPREQINQITSFIDASNVYGSSEDEIKDLRLGKEGKLQSTPLKNRKELLPAINRHIGADECRNHTKTLFCFRAGDARCNEQPGLTAMHTIWQREHNRLAVELAAINPHWDDERIFQETRRIIGAMMQHITYNEWLPVVLGDDVMHIFNLTVTKQGFARQDNYNVNLNPTISNVFATSAFRFGHSLVQNTISRYSKLHQKLHYDIPLHKELFNPISLHMFGSLDRIVLGVANEPSQSVDNLVSPELTNHLFKKHNSGPGMDLFSMNIQRGREHGIPAYNKWRKVCGLRVLKSFEDLYSVMQPGIATKIQQLYDDIEDIDLFVGGLAEVALPGAMIGPTFSCIIAQQFYNLKRGDRFWHENQGLPSSFTSGYNPGTLKNNSLSCSESSFTWNAAQDTYNHSTNIRIHSYTPYTVAYFYFGKYNNTIVYSQKKLISLQEWCFVHTASNIEL